MTQTTPATPTDETTFASEWREWRASRKQNLRDPKGFLAITSLLWLGEEPVSASDAPGAWTSIDDIVRVSLADGEWLELDGERITGEYEFAPIPERGGVLVRFDGGWIEVAKRGGFDIIRPRRDDASFLDTYTQTPAYEPNAQWRLDATFLPFDEPRPVTVDGAVDTIQHVYDSPGELEFTVDGEAHRLLAFPGRDDGLLVLFKDATSGVTTYSALRSVGVGAPDADGHTVLDFNRASNLPCAYTDLATCPLPPAENRLDLAIEAGEQTPLERTHAAPSEIGLELVDATPGA
jgi:uncharacterized protein (DUF1684 family)